MLNEFELVEHNKVHDLFYLLIEIQYRRPHLHTDIEIIYVLEGVLTVLTEGQEYLVQQNEIIVLNSCQLHELRSKDKALLLIMQIGPQSFEAVFPKINELYFDSAPIPAEKIDPHFINDLFRSCKVFFQEQVNFELLCHGFASILMFDLMRMAPYQLISENEQGRLFSRKERVKRISDYIHAHYQEKLLLADIAEQEDLSISYLSHFFHDHFGLSFQEYLNVIRCEKAQQLLIHTKHNLLTICELSGFSDVRYMNRSFAEIYDVSPKEFRKKAEKLPSTKLMNLNQEKDDQQYLYSKDESLAQLEKYQEHF